VQIFVDEIQQYFIAYKVISLVFYIVFGLIFHLKSFAFDVILFFKELWKKKIPLVKETENIGKYSIKSELMKIIVKMVKKTGRASNANFMNNLNNNNNNNNINNSNSASNLFGILSPSGNNNNNNNNTAFPEAAAGNPQDLKVTLEKFLFLLAMQLDPKADKIYKDNLNIYDYSVEKEINKPKAQILERITTENEDDLNLKGFKVDNGFNFNSNNSNYSPIFERQGFNYSDVLDYLLNFCDEKYHIDIPTLINIMTNGLRVYEIRLFYANISDKNYKNYTAKKQQIFFAKIDTVIYKETKVEKKYTTKMSGFVKKTLNALKSANKSVRTIKSIKETEKSEKISKVSKESFSQHLTSNVGDLTETKGLYNKNLKYLNNPSITENNNNNNNNNINSNLSYYNYNLSNNINNLSNNINELSNNINNLSDNNNNLNNNSNNLSNNIDNLSNNIDNLNNNIVEVVKFEQKKSKIKSFKSVASNVSSNRGKTKEKDYKKKIEQTKNFFALPDILSIPLITRTCVVSFYNDLKEFQADLSKKISENILKNQKYLEEILKDKKNNIYNPENNSNNNNNDINKRPNNNKVIMGRNLSKTFDFKDTATNDKYRKNNANRFNNENFNVDSLKKENLNLDNVENFEIRINNLEEKMERMLLMTEKIFDAFEKQSGAARKDLDSRGESLRGDMESNRSSSTMKIEKYYGQMDFDAFDN